jgi:APA family basic amino acid/polyamine antiporter
MRSTDGKLGLFDSVHLLVGAMIGSAIFSLSGITILQAGPASILSWILGGVILLAYGLQTAELASRYPQSGGVFAFPAIVLGKTREQGRVWGWVSAWAYLFGCVAGAAFSAIYIGIYLGVAFPRLASLQVPIAIISVLLCGYLNLVRFKITQQGDDNSHHILGTCPFGIRPLRLCQWKMGHHSLYSVLYPREWRRDRLP